MDVEHDAHVRSLEDVRGEVYDHLDAWVVELGALLAEAKALCRRGSWRSWAESELPLPVEHAERAIMVYIGLRDLPDRVISRLPRPWMAIFARNQPRERRNRAHITSSAPMRAHSSPDLVAGALLGLDPAEISPEIASGLRDWLDSAPAALIDAS